MSETLNVHQAALLLHVHSSTVSALARAGIIPATKVGRAWVFVKSLLLEYLVRQSLARVSVADALDYSECRSTEEKIPRHGGSSSRPSPARVESLYRSALELPTDGGPKRLKPSSKPSDGNKPSSVSSLDTLGKRPS
ncbi:MAG: helix-turn-helix domain-containing protein [Burkholderiaceae bacterium]|nr:helix-turn-helix domain-containing protein [Burkholderiaceae bacterium]